MDVAIQFSFIYLITSHNSCLHLPFIVILEEKHHHQIIPNHHHVVTAERKNSLMRGITLPQDQAQERAAPCPNMECYLYT